MKKMEAVLKAVVNASIGKERDGWPPVCVGIFHQPERPESAPGCKENAK